MTSTTEARSPWKFPKIEESVLWFGGPFILFFIASKVEGLSLGYGLDDYYTIANGNDSLSNFFYSQGRFTFAVMHNIFSAMGLAQPEVATIGFFLAAFGLSAVAWLTLGAWLRSRPLVAVATGSVLGAHPFFSEYVTFRQSLFPMGVCLVLVACALYVYRSSETLNPLRSTVVASIVAVAAGVNQIALSFFCIAILGAALHRNAHRSPLRAIVEAVKTTFVLGLISSLIYFAIFSLTTTFVGLAPDSRTSVLGLGDFNGRIRELARLVVGVFTGTHSLGSPVIAVLVVVALIIIILGQRDWHTLKRSLFLGGTVGSIGAVLALLPLAIAADWHPVPRTLVALPLGLALAFVVLTRGLEGRSVMISGWALVVAATLLSGISSALLTDQHRLNRWDISLAREVINGISHDNVVGPNTTVVLHVSKIPHAKSQSMSIGDANLSAFAVPWAVDALFEEANGRELNVMLGDANESSCTLLGDFPHRSSIFRKNNELHVCL